MRTGKAKILFLAPYPFGRVASQRFRFEQYWEDLKKEYQIDFQSFLSVSTFNILYQPGFHFSKVKGVFFGFIKRFFLLFRIKNYDYVFIHREASPLGPPVFEWIIAKLFLKKIIYDFDDAIWLNSVSGENRLASIFKCNWKVKFICKWSFKVTCGNHFLAEYARQYCSKAYFLPTTLNTENIPFKSTRKNSGKLVIGWTGTHSTLKYLQSLVPVLQEIKKEIDFDFLVIADKDPQLTLRNYRFKNWNKNTEWEDLSEIDIGLMPLGNTAWEEGKCGFKALQYMAAGIPALVSPTMANKSIVTHGKIGYICNSPEEWRMAIFILSENKEVNKKLALSGRKKLEEEYSHQVWKEFYLQLFQQEL